MTVTAAFSRLPHTCAACNASRKCPQYSECTFANSSAELIRTVCLRSLPCAPRCPRCLWMPFPATSGPWCICHSTSTETTGSGSREMLAGQATSGAFGCCVLLAWPSELNSHSLCLGWQDSVTVNRSHAQCCCTIAVLRVGAVAGGFRAAGSP